REFDGRTTDGHLARVAPQDHLPRREHLILVPLLRAAEDRLDPGRELARGERLRDIVVGAELEPSDTVRLLIARREHDDRHLRARANAAAALGAVDPRQADVEDDEPDGIAAQLSEDVFA